MTTERARTLATEILNRTRGIADVNYAASEAEAVILAYRDEVLREVRDRTAWVPGFGGCDSAARKAAVSSAYDQRRLFREMLDEMIAETSQAGTTPPVNTGGPTPERIQNIDRILREGRAVNTARTDHDWIGAALIMLTRHFPAISDRDRVFWADVKREWPDVG